VVRLRLTKDAQKHSDLARERKHAILASALESLDEGAHVRLRRGLEVLAALTNALGRESER
jgi:hypothetical protein